MWQLVALECGTLSLPEAKVELSELWNLSGCDLVATLSDLVLWFKTSSNPSHTEASAGSSYSDCPALSRVADGIWVGGIQSLDDPSELAKRGITGVVNSSGFASQRAPAKRLRGDSGLEYLDIDVLDVVEADIISCLPRVVRFIQSHREAGGEVLCHCFHGVSRSSTTAAAYLLAARVFDSVSSAIESMQTHRR